MNEILDKFKPGTIFWTDGSVKLIIWDKNCFLANRLTASEGPFLVLEEPTVETPSQICLIQINHIKVLSNGMVGYVGLSDESCSKIESVIA
jgi:hypothetical protein